MSASSKLYNYKVHQLVKVVDGDTIDAPESRTRDKQEKVRGLAAKARLKELLDEDSQIFIESFGVGKFGRLLAKIYLGETQQDIIKLMISEGHGREYYGGSRK